MHIIVKVIDINNLIFKIMFINTLSSSCSCNGLLHNLYLLSGLCGLLKIFMVKYNLTINTEMNVLDSTSCK